MNADQLKKLTTDALDRLGALLDAGQSDQLTALLKTMARFHRYSFHNVCLIASQRPDATRVAGFHTWRSLGRFVRKGEKGIVILAPIVGRRSDAEDDDSKQVVGFRAAHVFDVAQTDGEALPEVAAASGDPGERTGALRGAIGREIAERRFFGLDADRLPPPGIDCEHIGGTVCRGVACSLGARLGLSKAWSIRIPASRGNEFRQ